MALMATHPRDFPIILDLEKEINKNNDIDNDNDIKGSDNDNEMMKILPCLGVHPWFLHELDQDDWTMVPSSSSSSSPSSDSSSTITGRSTTLVADPDDNIECDNKDSGNYNDNDNNNNNNNNNDTLSSNSVPKWIADLEAFLLEHPHVPVGEIGLDNFHFDPYTKKLTTPMERQVEAFRYQLHLATKHRRPVSVHCVRAMGKIMDTLTEVADANYNNELLLLSLSSTTTTSMPLSLEDDHGLIILPPRIYFHAFGGKAATASQLVKTLEKRRRIKIIKKKDDKNKNNNNKKFKTTIPPKVYFGFAPLVNFESPKTLEVIQTIGIDRLVLETDHEDIQKVGPSMKLAIAVISKALEVSPEELIRVTNDNVKDLYYYS